MVAVALYETLEHMRVVGTHYRPTRMHQAYNATPSEGRHSWHYETQSSPQLPQDRIAISDDYGRGGAAEVVENGSRRRRGSTSISGLLRA